MSDAPNDTQFIDDFGRSILEFKARVEVMKEWLDKRRLLIEKEIEVDRTRKTSLDMQESRIKDKITQIQKVMGE